MHPAAESLEFPIDDFRREVAEIIVRRSLPGRSAAISAIRHLNLAWRLRSIDPQMAMLRSITAKEEAATALFRALKERRYRNADKLNARDHRHKNAIMPFVQVIAKHWEKRRTLVPSWALAIEAAETSNARVRLVFGVETADGTVSYVFPSPPLNFEFGSWSSSSQTVLPETFRDGIAAMVADLEGESLRDYLRSCANDRNLLLYASSDGPAAMPDKVEEQLLGHQWAVFVIMKFYIMVAPYPQQQLFVQQLIDVFLRFAADGGIGRPTPAA